MWPNDLQKWQNGGEIITNPARVGMIEVQSPRPAQSPGGQPRPNQPGPTNPPQSLQTPANRPQQTGQPTGPTNPAQSIPGPINPSKPRGQPPLKQSPNRWGPIAPQTGQTTNPGQSPAKPKQPRKRAFEVSTN